MTALEAHEAQGRYFNVGPLRSFALDEGRGPTVVLMHGVPASSYVYRKVVESLADHGVRAVAFDLPGLGLADRPKKYDYRWTNLGKFAVDALDALGIGDFHLVVHDIGGPIGFEVAASIPERIRAITLLNTIIRVDRFVKPWPMRPFEYRLLGEAWLGGSGLPMVFRELMYAIGIGDRHCTSEEDVEVYHQLLVRSDGGRAFLEIMRGFETTQRKANQYSELVSSHRFPTQIVWAKDDTALRYSEHGRIAEELVGIKAKLITGKHFFQEDQPLAIAEAIMELERAIRRRSIRAANRDPNQR